MNRPYARRDAATVDRRNEVVADLATSRGSWSELVALEQLLGTFVSVSFLHERSTRHGDAYFDGTGGAVEGQLVEVTRDEITLRTTTASGLLAALRVASGEVIGLPFATLQDGVEVIDCPRRLLVEVRESVSDSRTLRGWISPPWSAGEIQEDRSSGLRRRGLAG